MDETDNSTPILEDDTLEEQDSAACGLVIDLVSDYVFFVQDPRDESLVIYCQCCPLGRIWIIMATRNFWTRFIA